MYQVKFIIGETRWEASFAKLDHGALLSAIGKSKLLGNQEVWFGDPEYSDDGSCEAAIVVNGDRVVGRFVARQIPGDVAGDGAVAATVIVATAGPCPKLPGSRVSRAAVSDVIPF